MSAAVACDRGNAAPPSLSRLVRGEGIGVYVLPDVLARRERGSVRFRVGSFNQRVQLFGEGLDLGVVENIFLPEDLLESADRVMFLVTGDFFFRAVVLRIRHRVP